VSRAIPKVNGRIINLTKEEIANTKIEYTLVTPLQQLQVTKTCTLNSDGSFELKLDYAFPYQQIWIDVDNLFYTGIYANTDLFLELNATLLKTREEAEYNGSGVAYRGKDGAFNEYTTNHMVFRREEQLDLSKKLQICLGDRSKEYDAFVKTYDSLHRILNNLDDEYIRQNPSPFSWALKNERKSNYFADLCVKHWGKQMPPALFEKVKAHKAYLTSNDGMLFYQYLSTYLNALAFKRVNSGKESSEDAITVQTIRMLDSLFTPSKSDFFKIRFSDSDPRGQKQKMEIVMPTVKTLWCKNVINSEYNKTLEKLASINKILNQSKPIVSNNLLGQPVGELPFGAKLYEVKGIKVDSLLYLLKCAFKDKALYIDFWATWCAPCISEFPYSKTLSDASKDLPVEFIYLCTSESSDMEKWKAKIVEYNLSGHHIFVEKSIASALMHLFSLSGFPSYLLINKKGNYKADIPERPSELNRERLLELITQ
jgi:thiol-disulfide isomerase/thioredoxin